MMLAILRCFGVMGALFLGACATQDMRPSRNAPDLVPLDQINIASQFETTALTPLTLSSAVRPCLPWLLMGDGPGLPKLSKEITDSKNTLIIYGHPKSGNLFVMTREQGFCVQRSTTMLPILAAEALLDTAHPMGMPAAVLEEWNKQIAKRLATVGVAKVAFTQILGDAYIVQYWMESEGARLRLKYRYTFKKKGEWERDLIDLSFNHPQANSFRAVGRGDDIKTGLRDQDHIKTSPIDHRYNPGLNLLRPSRF